MKKIIKNILKEETDSSKLTLVKSLIHQLFDGVSFIEQSTYDNKPLLKVYFDSDDTAANIESWFGEEICNTIMEYSGNNIILCPYWVGNWDFRKKIVDFYIDTKLLKYDNLGNVINEDYNPAGKEVTPNEIVVHKANPMFRDSIMSEGLKTKAGECYRIYVGYGEKCIPAIFATNSTNKRAWFDSTYDDDVWFIDTTMIPDVKWYKDRHFESTKKHIVTFENIPPEALTLKYEGTGKGDEFLVKENVDDGEKNLRVINLLLSQVSWDGLCDIWVEYNPIDKDYEIRSKSTIRPYDHDEIIKDLDYIDNALRSMGLSVYIYTPWYVDSCEDEVKFLNESKEKSTKELITTVLNTIVLPDYEHVICGFEVKEPHERFDTLGNTPFQFMSVTIIFIGGLGTKLWPQTQGVQRMYDDVTDEVWDVIYNYTNEAVDVYYKTVRDCGKENIYLRESKEPEPKYLSLIKELIEPLKDEDGVCDIDVSYDDEDDMYSVYIVIGTEEMNEKFFYVPAMNSHISKLRMNVKNTIKQYIPIDNLYVGSYGKPNCEWKPYIMTEKHKVSKDEYVELYRDNDFVLTIPLTHDASKKYGSDTKWCTTTRECDKKFNDHKKYGVLGYITVRDNELKRRLENNAFALYRLYGDNVNRTIVFDDQNNEYRNGEQWLSNKFDRFDKLSQFYKMLQKFNNYFESENISKEPILESKENERADIKNVPSDIIPKIEKVLNKTMSNIYDWWKEIEIKSIKTSGKPFNVLTIDGTLKVDEEWGANQWRKYYDTLPFPGNDEGWEEMGYKDYVTLGDITGLKDSISENLKEDITSVINLTTNLNVTGMQLATIDLIFI